MWSHQPLRLPGALQEVSSLSVQWGLVRGGLGPGQIFSGGGLITPAGFKHTGPPQGEQVRGGSGSAPGPRQGECG